VGRFGVGVVMRVLVIVRMGMMVGGFMSMAVAVIMFVVMVMSMRITMLALVNMPMVVLMLMLVRAMARVVMGLRVRERMQGFMQLVVDHLKRNRIDDRKNTRGHCGVQCARLDCGRGDAIAKQRHGLIEDRGCGGLRIEVCQMRQGMMGVGHGAISRAASCGSRDQ
jgi:hypothetical protein